MNYKYQLDIVQEIFNTEGAISNGDCPFCLHRRCFNINIKEGDLVWKCFSANCTSKGRYSNNFSKEDVENFISQKKQLHNHKFEVPKTFMNPLVHPKARAYLNTYDITNTSARVMYDVKQERVVFLVEHEGQVVDATGRAQGDFHPKWFRYGNSNVPFITGSNRQVGIIVEDCVSACAVEMKSGFTGISLMGTNLKDESIQHIVNAVDSVVVCLDFDATKKSMDLKNKLDDKIKTYIWMIEKDLKNFTNEEMKGWKDKICNLIS